MASPYHYCRADRAHLDFLSCNIKGISDLLRRKLLKNDKDLFFIFDKIIKNYDEDTKNGHPKFKFQTLLNFPIFSHSSNSPKLFNFSQSFYYSFVILFLLFYYKPNHGLGIN